MSAAWPATLPQAPITNGFSESPADTSLRTKMDVGPGKSRRRISKGAEPHKLPFKMSSAQVDDFKYFHGVTLLSGTLPYTWTHPRSLASGEWMFVSQPVITSAGGNYYLVSFDAELLP